MPAQSVQGTGGKTGGPSCEIQRSARRAEFMGNRLQLAAATPVSGGRVSLLLGCQAGELGRAGHGRLLSCVRGVTLQESPESRPAKRGHEMEVEEWRSGRMHKTNCKRERWKGRGW